MKARMGRKKGTTAAGAKRHTPHKGAKQGTRLRSGLAGTVPILLRLRQSLFCSAFLFFRIEDHGEYCFDDAFRG